MRKKEQRIKPQRPQQIMSIKALVRKEQINQGLKGRKNRFTRDLKPLLHPENKKDSSTHTQTPSVKNISS
jgi:hypothetical protein